MEKTWLTNQQAFIDTNLKVYLPVVLLPSLLGMTIVFEVTGGGCRGLGSRVEKNLVNAFLYYFCYTRQTMFMKCIYKIGIVSEKKMRSLQ